MSSSQSSSRVVSKVHKTSWSYWDHDTHIPTDKCFRLTPICTFGSWLFSSAARYDFFLFNKFNLYFCLLLLLSLRSQDEGEVVGALRGDGPGPAGLPDVGGVRGEPVHQGAAGTELTVVLSVERLSWGSSAVLPVQLVLIWWFAGERRC